LKLLVIDDDRLLADFIRQGLEEDGFVVDVAHRGGEGRTLALVHDYDALIVDVMLPDVVGYDLVRELRVRERTTPVLMLTSKQGSEDVVHGLDAGADDYLTKPFALDVLRARVRALLRRGGATRVEAPSFRGVVLDRATHQALYQGKPLRLTPKEHRLLSHFLMRPERAVTRSELLEKVWDLQFDPGSNVVDVHVARLRGKLKQTDVDLVTIRGAGYMLRAREEEGPEGE